MSPTIARRFLLLSLIVLSGAQSVPAAPSPEDRGLEIAREVDRRRDGFGDFTARTRMILTNRQGQESIRQTRSRTLEVPGDGDRMLIVFDDPKDVAGTALLSFSHKTDPDDQWLFLPALKRVKRIAADNRSGPFLGSEFAYEDISAQEVEKFTWKYLRDESLDGMPCFVLERIPVDPHSGYTRQIVWVDQAEYREQRIDFYDRKGTLLKTLRFGDYARYLDRLWRARDMFMENHQTGKTTRILWTDLAYRTGLDPADFTAHALERAK